LILEVAKGFDKHTSVWIETVARKTDLGWIEHVFGKLLFHGAAMLVKPSYHGSKHRENQL